MTTDEARERLERFAGVCVFHLPPIISGGCPHCHIMAAADEYAKAAKLETFGAADPRNKDGKLASGWNWTAYFVHLDALRAEIEAEG